MDVKSYHVPITCLTEVQEPRFGFLESAHSDPAYSGQTGAGPSLIHNT